MFEKAAVPSPPISNNTNASQYHGDSAIVARPIRRVQVKGRKREFMIYELLGIRASDDPELKPQDDAARLCELTREASLYFERGEFDQAARRYEDILGAFPDDPVAKSLLAMCLAKASA